MQKIALIAAVAAFTVMPVTAQRSSNTLIDLWSQGKTAFGVFVPNEAARPAGPGGAGAAGAPRAAGAPGAPGAAAAQAAPRQRPRPVYTEAGGEKLAANPLYDYVFLNLEGAYDGAAVKAIASGLGKAKG